MKHFSKHTPSQHHTRHILGYGIRMYGIVVVLLALLIAPQLYAQKREPGKVKVLVIDPGHGGEKPGAHGKEIVEKELTLAVAKKFGSLVEKHIPDVQVVYTRTTDVDVSLAERTVIANKAKADLFISIHANSHPTGKPSGVETFVMGLSQSKANLEVAKRENADILLESGYQKNSAYQGFDPNSPESYVMFAMYQNAYLSKSLDFANYIQKQYSANLRTINRGVKQAELFVIYKTAMPAVLTEIGFISNPTEEAYLKSETGRNNIAVCLYNAFANYKAHEEGTQPLTIKSYTDNPAGQQVAEEKKSNDAKAAKERAAREAELRAEQQRQAAAEAAAREQAEREAAEAAIAQKKAAEEAAKLAATQEAAKVAAEQEAKRAEEMRLKAEAQHLAAAADSINRSNDNASQTPATEDKSSEATKQNTPTQVEQPQVAESSVVTFRVQFLISDKKLKAGDKELRGLNNFTTYQRDNNYIYMWGNCTTLDAAKALQSDVRSKGFKDAFVVAFANNERISLQEARAILMEQ